MESLPAHVIARALAPDERCAMPDATIGSTAWLEAWAAAASRGRLAWGASQWDALGIDLAQVARGLGDVDGDAPGVAMPAWVDALAWFLGHLPDGAPEVSPGAGPLDAILASSYTAALACIADLRREGAMPDAWQGQTDARLATSLAGRIASAQARALQPEVIASRAVGLIVLPADAADWRERIIEFPALARTLGIAVASWRQGILDLIAHWTMDIDGGDGADLVVDVHLGLGDPHQGGQSVALLVSSRGESIIHKPKSQGGPAIWQQLVDALLEHPSCAEIGVRRVTRAIRDHGGYGWDEVLTRDPQVTADLPESRAWLRTFGALVRVCELLECRDMWLDNLITHDGTPVYIDVETVLQPRQRSDAAADLIAETALPTGAISLPIRLPDGTTEDIGVLRRPGAIGLPFRREDLGGMTPIGRFGSDGIMRWEPEPWRPQFVDALDSADEVLIGYDAVDAALTDTTLLTQIEALVQSLAEQPTRVVLRSTFTCYSLMQDSLRPEVMHDGRAREIALSSLHAPAVEALLGGRPAEEARWLAALARADAQALSRLDVPLVRHDPRTGAITLDDGTVMPAPEGRAPALELCLARLRDPGRLRAMRRAVVGALVEIALAPGTPDAAARQRAGIARLTTVVADEFEGHGISRDDAASVLAEFGYASSGASSSS